MPESSKLLRKVKRSTKRRDKKKGAPTRDSVLQHLGDIFFAKKTPLNVKVSMGRLLLEHLGTGVEGGDAASKRAEALIKALLT